MRSAGFSAMRGMLPGMADDKLPMSGDIPRDEADFLAALVLSSNDAIYSKDTEARVTSWNPAAERLYGYTAQEIIGQPLSILMPPDRRGEEITILNRILAGEYVEHHETVRLRKDGSTVEVSVSVSPVHDAQGNIVEAAVVARDISQRKRREAEAAEAQRKQAIELNDAVVQGLAVAKLAFEMGDTDKGVQALTETLDTAKHIVARLLGDGEDIDPGDLARSEAADPSGPGSG